MSATRRYLQLEVGTRVPDVEQWLLDNGRDFEPAPLPKGVRRGRQQNCYQNSISLICKDPERYVYCEGRATSAATGSWAMPYAWCYDRETGLVVDRTWREPRGYLGLSIRTAYACRVFCETKWCGVIDNWEREWPLIMGAVPREEWEEQL